jgi:hypothetical protein
MIRAVAMAGLMLQAVAAPPLQAQGRARADAEDGCNLKPQQKRGSRLFGSILGGIANRTLGSTGIGGFVSLNTLSHVLTDAIACRLDADEQKQAAAATEQAVTRGEGATVEWTSETRANVSGRSTATQQTARADGGVCMDVTDVIIVEGEETMVSKRMCRAPGATGFTIAEA